jgi:AhpD family alkylhydroperoxidase
MPLPLPLHTIDSVGEPARGLLVQVQQTLGFVPSLYAGMANAAPLLQGYMALSAGFAQSSFSPTEQQLIQIVTSVENGCEYCVAAHSLLARRAAGMPAAVLEALRAGESPADPQLAALAAFTRAVVRQRGWVDGQPALRHFLAAGYRPEQALEVVLGVGMKIISNYAEHLLEVPLDAAFHDERWRRDPAQASAAC